MTRIKICGLKRPADIDAVNRLRPDYVGFVFARSSSRYVSPEQAARLRQMLRKDIIAVGVIVDASFDEIVALIRDGVIDMIQLHGAQDEDYIRRLKSLSDAPVIKALAITGPDDARRQADTAADFLLLDSGGGGTGQRFDWSWLRTERPRKPWFLAGGLNPGNVVQAIAAACPFAVDVSSGVETNGSKDYAKISEFISAVRGL